MILGKVHNDTTTRATLCELKLFRKLNNLKEFKKSKNLKHVRNFKKFLKILRKF